MLAGPAPLRHLLGRLLRRQVEQVRKVGNQDNDGTSVGGGVAGAPAALCVVVAAPAADREGGEGERDLSNWCDDAAYAV